MRRLQGTGVVGGIAVGQAVVRVRRDRAVRVPIAEAGFASVQVPNWRRSSTRSC